MTDIERIQRLLAIPAETETVEFKRLGGDDGKIVKKVVQTAVAMANTYGGEIVLGVDDPEKTSMKGADRVYGIEENPELFDEIRREIRKVTPPLVVRYDNLIASPGKTVVVAAVPKVADQLRSREDEVFIRGKKGNIKIGPQDVVKMSYAKGIDRADRELVSVDFDLLATAQFDAWKSARGIPGASVSEILYKTGLARKDGQGTLLPTRAAVMLFAEFPTNLLDTKCAVRVYQYSGKSEKFGEVPNLVGLPKTIGGAVVELIRQAHEYVLGLLRSGLRIPSGFVNTYKIPERVIKEAITNAVIHRDYHIKRDIEIRIFEDRIEIESPGLLPFNITPRNIGEVRADGYRNDLLVKHLREFPAPPNLDQNEGVRAMKGEMAASGLYPPVFSTYPELSDSVRVVLRNESAPSEWEKIVRYLLVHGYVDNEHAREACGVLQTTKMSELLKNWTRQGLLVRVPSDPNVKKGVKYLLQALEGGYIGK